MKKRVISCLMAAALAFSSVPAALAASAEAQTAAQSLYELGLFNGTGTDTTGKPDFALDRSLTRSEAAAMLVRLLGGELRAKAGKWENRFTDVDKTGWAMPYIGYACDAGLVSGTSANTFSGDATVTAAQYLTLVLRALGYESGTDFQWNKAWELSDRIGLTDGQFNESTQTFTRGDVAVISYNALHIPLKGQSTTLDEFRKESAESGLAFAKATAAILRDVESACRSLADAMPYVSKAETYYKHGYEQASRNSLLIAQGKFVEAKSDVVDIKTLANQNVFKKQSELVSRCNKLIANYDAMIAIQAADPQSLNVILNGSNENLALFQEICNMLR